VEDLAKASRLSIANASQHLRLMRRAGLLASQRDGKQIRYRLSDSAVLDLVAALQRVGERNIAEAREIVRKPSLHCEREIGFTARSGLQFFRCELCIWPTSRPLHDVGH
jgi:DNA-binding transcriptional regulator PaaX